MAILPDKILRVLGPKLLDPFTLDMIQPASLDVHVDRYFYIAQGGQWGGWIDPSLPSYICFGDMIEIPEGKPFKMNPGCFALASTFQKITVPRNLVARFEGKSSLGRLGLLTHITAGFIDPGFEGYITLELKNVTAYQWVIWPGMKIGQICFEELSESVEHPYGCSGYGSHYQGQRGPTQSKSHRKFSKIDVYNRRLCVNKNSNVCVAEGCYGESCIKNGE